MANRPVAEQPSPVQMRETATGVQLDMMLPNQLRQDMRVLAARVPGLAYLQNFDGRGKHDTKFSFFQQKNMLRVQLPRHRYPVDRTLFSITSDIELCRRYIFKIFNDIIKLLQEDNTGLAKVVKMLSFDVLSFDFSIEFPEYDNRQIYFRYSILEFWVGLPSSDKPEQFSECSMAFSYVPGDFYGMPVMQALSEIGLHSRGEMVAHLRKFFPLCLTLHDLHFYNRMIDRSKYPEQHIRLFLHFTIKMFATSTVLPFSRKMMSMKPTTIQYTQKVFLEEGDCQVTVVFQKEDSVRVRIYDGFQQRRPELYKQAYDNVLQQYPTLKDVMHFQAMDNKETFKQEGRLYLRLDNRRQFQQAVLALYKYLFYKLERANLSRKQHANIIKELRNSLRFISGGNEIAIGFNDQRCQFFFQGIFSVAGNQQSPIAVMFRKHFGDYISMHFQLIPITTCVEDFCKRRDQNLLLHFLDTYKKYEEIMSSPTIEQRKKDNFNRLVEVLIRKIKGEHRPHRIYRYFKIDRLEDKDSDTVYYDITLKPYEIRSAIRQRGVYIRVRTNLEDAWLIRDYNKKPTTPSEKERRRIEDLKDIARDLKIDEFSV